MSKKNFILNNLNYLNMKKRKLEENLNKQEWKELLKIFSSIFSFKQIKQYKKRVNNIINLHMIDTFKVVSDKKMKKY